MPQHKKQSHDSIKESFLQSLLSINDLEGWSIVTGNEDSCYTSHSILGQLITSPREDEGILFLVCTTQESEVLHIRRELDIPKDITALVLKFDYNFITQEYPAVSETDALSVWVSDISNTSKDEVIELDNTDSSLSLDRLKFPEGDIAVAKTGWSNKRQQISTTLLPKTGGKLFLNFKLKNKGDRNQYPFVQLNNLDIFMLINTNVPARSVKQLDVFEAVFGGSFESPLPLTGWTINGSCYTAFNFGQFRATDRELFLVCNTYPNEESAWISREIDIPEGVTSLPLSLDYNFLSQEFPGNGLSDWDIIELSIKSANGNVTRLVAKSSDDISMVEDTLYIGENQLAIGRTGWQTLSVDVPVSSGKGEIKIMLSSEGGGNGLHSALLVDNIRFASPD